MAWLSFQPLYLDTMCALEDLLTSLLQQNMTPQGLQIMIEVCRGCTLLGVMEFLASFPPPPPLWLGTTETT